MTLFLVSHARTGSQLIQRSPRDLVTNADELEAAGYGHWLVSE